MAYLLGPALLLFMGGLGMQATYWRLITGLFNRRQIRYEFFFNTHLCYPQRHLDILMEKMRLETQVLGIGISCFQRPYYNAP